jgi:hypothetical protein
MNIETEIKLVTPVWAEMVLKSCNTDNRPMRLHWVKALAGAIKRGEWKITHQGIGFDSDGILLDGQHRLAAIVMSGQAVQMPVTIGLDRAAFSVVDVHTKRSIGDLTNLSRRTAEICNFAAQIYFGTKPPSAVQVQQIADSGLASISEKLLNFCNTNRAVISATPIRLAVCLNIIKNPEKTHEFLTIYKRMVLSDFVNMTPFQAAISRRISSKQEVANGSNSMRLLALFLKLLDESNKNLTKVYLSQEEISEAPKYARSILETLINQQK